MVALLQRYPPGSWRRIVWSGIGFGATLWLINLVVHVLFHAIAGDVKDLSYGEIDLLVGLVAFSLLALYFQSTAYTRRTSDDRLRKLSRAVEQSPSTVMITDLDGNIEYVNPKFTQLTGYTLDEVRGQKPSILKSGETSDEEYGRLWEAIARGEEWRGEFHNVKKNGELYWESALISPVKDSYGRVTHYLAVKEDITARKQVEAAEREQRALAEALRDTATAVNQLLDMSEILDFILANVERVVPHDAALVMLIVDGIASVVRFRGYSEQGEETVKHIRVPVAESDEIQQIVKTQKPVILSGMLRGSDWLRDPALGEVRSRLVAPIRLRGTVIGLLALDSSADKAFTDVHAGRLQAFADQAAIAIQNARTYDAMRDYALERERQVIERSAELERERAKLRAMFDSMGEGVAYVENERVQYVNHALEEMLGYERHEIVDQQLTLFVLAVDGSSDGPHSLRERINQAFRSSLPWRGELRLQRKDGSTFDAAVTTTQVRSQYDTTLGRVTIIRDVSREKALQAQKDRFLTHAAHELRTPMSNLKTRLYLMRHQPDKVGQHLDIMEKVSDGMANLIEDLLDVVRLEHNAIVLQRETVLAQDIVRAAVEPQQSRVEQGSLKIAVDLPEAPQWICVDRRRMIQALDNILTVAVQESLPEGHVRVSLEKRNGGGPHGVLLTIQDSGPHHSDFDPGAAFEPFFHATYGGSGSVSLGLTLAKEIVELHGGMIALENVAEQGRRVTISLDDDDYCMGSAPGLAHAADHRNGMGT